MSGVLLGDGKSQARRDLEGAVARGLAGLPPGTRVVADSPGTQQRVDQVLDALFEDPDARWAVREYLRERASSTVPIGHQGSLP
jgi:hypothetical protein